MLPIRIGIFRDLKSQKVHFFGLPDYRTTFLFKQGDPKQLEKQENSKGRSSPEDTELPWATKTKHTSFLTQGTNIDPATPLVKKREQTIFFQKLRYKN